MDTRQLRHFLAIYDHGSVMRAADVLHVAQSALSATLRKLEEDLGVALFERRSTGVIATPEGRDLALHARGILHAIDEARDAVQGRSAQPVGRVTVAVPTSLTNVLAVPLIENTAQRFPDVRLRIVETMTGYIPDWILNGQVDLGLLYSRRDSLGLESVRLLTEELYLVAPDEGAMAPLRTDGEVPLERLEGLDLILPGRVHGLREIIERAAKTSGVQVRVPIEVDALPQIKRLVQRGRGFTIMSLAALYEETEAAFCTARITNPPIQRSVYLARSASRSLTRAAREIERELIRIIQSEARKSWWVARV